MRSMAAWSRDSGMKSSRAAVRCASVTAVAPSRSANRYAVVSASSMSLPVNPAVRRAKGMKSAMAEASLCFLATTSKICRRATSSGMRIGILMSVRPDRRMAESMRSTRFVLSMRRTRPRSALSAQKLKDDARMRSATPESPPPESRLPPSA